MEYITSVDNQCPEARITNGLCTASNVNEIELARITAGPRPHRGDDGYSLLMSGERISKAHVACAFYQSVEELQQAIAETICKDTLYSMEVTETLKWLFRNLFSLSSYVFCKGDSQRHQFPDNFLDFIEADCTRLEEAIGDAKDFLMYSNPCLLRLNKIRLASRKTESTYVAWNQSEEMTRFLRKHPTLIYDIDRHTQILNRLSSWMFWVTRMQGLVLRNAGLPIQEKYWDAQCEPFPM